MQSPKDKEEDLKMRPVLMNSFSNYNIEYFRKYINGGNGFDSKLNMMKKIENNQLKREDMESLLNKCDNDKENLEEGE